MYKFYNPNPRFKDFKNASKTGKHKKCMTSDCAIRAFSLCCGYDWYTAYEKLCEAGKYVCDVPNSRETMEYAMKLEGFKYVSAQPSKGEKRQTVAEFAKSHPHGTYLLSVANHFCGCKDGNYCDAWDSGAYSIYGYYIKKM